MKRLIYIYLYAIPAITFSEIHQDDLREFLHNAFQEEIRLIYSSESADHFFFHKGQLYAFMEVMRIIDED